MLINANNGYMGCGSQLCLSPRPKMHRYDSFYTIPLEDNGRGYFESLYISFLRLRLIKVFYGSMVCYKLKFYPIHIVKKRVSYGDMISFFIKFELSRLIYPMVGGSDIEETSRSLIMITFHFIMYVIKKTFILCKGWVWLENSGLDKHYHVYLSNAAAELRTKV